MKKPDWVEVDDHISTWEKIAEWYASLPKSLATTYEEFFDREMLRESAAHLRGSQKLNLAWEARSYHCPAISKWLCSAVEADIPYAQELLNYDPETPPGEEGKTIYDFTIIGLISENLTEQSRTTQPWRAFPPATMAAIIKSDKKWLKHLQQEEEGDAYGLLPGEEIAEHYPSWFDEQDGGYYVWEEMGRHYVVVKNGKNPVVMGRRSYEFLTYYAVHVKGLEMRIPSLLNPELESAPVKIPQVMKNFRFDFTNVRALDEAADMTGEKYVTLLDRLLKKYFGLIVAEVLLEQADGRVGSKRAKQINMGEAKANLETYANSVRHFGFTVPDSLDDLAEDYKGDYRRQSVELSNARKEAAQLKTQIENIKVLNPFINTTPGPLTLNSNPTSLTIDPNSGSILGKPSLGVGSDSLSFQQAIQPIQPLDASNEILEKLNAMEKAVQDVENRVSKLTEPKSLAVNAAVVRAAEQAGVDLSGTSHHAEPFAERPLPGEGVSTPKAKKHIPAKAKPATEETHTFTIDYTKPTGELMEQFNEWLTHPRTAEEKAKQFDRLIGLGLKPSELPVDRFESTRKSKAKSKAKPKAKPKAKK